MANAFLASSREALLDAHKEVLDVVYRALAPLLYPINQRTTVAVLPGELLLSSLEHLNIHDRFSASQVCHYWRTIALSSSRLWADMTEFGVANPRLDIALQRAGDPPC